METNETIQKLEWLLELKKTKKEPNTNERACFYQEWTKLAEQEGFSPAVEKYLYDGFVYQGAKPLRDYMRKSDEPLTVLKSLYEGRLFGNNCASTCQLLWHLLALHLNDSNQNIDIICSLIAKIPGAMINKERKPYSQASRCLKNNFYDALNPGVVLPPFQILYEHKLGKHDALVFSSKITETMKNVDYSKWSDKSKKNISLVDAWVRPLLQPSEKPDLECISPENNHPQNESLVQAVVQGENRIAVPFSKKEKRPDEKNEATTGAVSEKGEPKNSKSVGGLTQELADTKKLLAETKAAQDKTLQELDKALQALTDSLKKGERLQGELDQNVNELRIAEKRISELQRQVRSVEKKNEELEAELAQQKDLAEKALATVEILRRDREKQSDATIKRLNSRLRTYYEDYKEATPMQMSVDLGENMRDQLGDVFKILQDAGIITK